MDRGNSMLKKLIGESKRHKGRGLLCYVSAAAGTLDNTPVMAISYSENCSS